MVEDNSHDYLDALWPTGANTEKLLASRNRIGLADVIALAGPDGYEQMLRNNVLYSIKVQGETRDQLGAFTQLKNEIVKEAQAVASKDFIAQPPTVLEFNISGEPVRNAVEKELENYVYWRCGVNVERKHRPELIAYFEKNGQLDGVIKRIEALADNYINLKLGKSAPAAAR